MLMLTLNDVKFMIILIFGIHILTVAWGRLSVQAFVIPCRGHQKSSALVCNFNIIPTCSMKRNITVGLHIS